MINKVINVQGNSLSVSGKKYKLNKNVYVVGVGKAVIGMIPVVDDILGDHIVEGIASIPVGIVESLTQFGKINMLPKSNSKIKIFEGAKNNQPDQAAFETAKKIYSLVCKLNETDILLTLLSGGGSALLPYPKPPITLEELQIMADIMIRHAATIQQLNTVRKHTEILKGGGLAYAANNAQIVSLILSDIIGDPIDKIASGPTVTDLSTPQQCLRIFESLNIVNEIPKSIIEVVRSDMRNESWKKPLPVMNKIYSHNVIVGSNQVAMESACQAAETKGFLTFILSTTLCGEAKNIGKLFASLCKFLCGVINNTNSRNLAINELELRKRGVEKKSINKLLKLASLAKEKKKPICILGAGETVVTVHGKGRGGRNSEISLATAIELNNCKSDIQNLCVQFLSAGTDGQDGNTGAAGAFCNIDTIEYAKKQEIFNPDLFLNDNDSFTFFERLNNGKDLFMTGMTGTNVMDFHVMIIKKQNE